VDADQPRLLHKTIGYTSNPRAALPAEPEAVPSEFQAELSSRARRNQEQRQRREWERTHSTISQAIASFRESGPIDPQVWNAARAVERAAQAVDRRVGL
jgi:hypothetical protein